MEQKGRYDFEVTVNVANTGERDGEEVVQLYLRDEFASVSRPMMQPKHFDRKMLRKGESRKVTFRITEDDLGMINARMERVVEPGSFQVTVGGGVGNQMLRSTFEVE